jgi:hypothetical protein
VRIGQLPLRIAIEIENGAEITDMAETSDADDIRQPRLGNLASNLFLPRNMMELRTYERITDSSEKEMPTCEMEK